jgi:hypothetical protein
MMVLEEDYPDGLIDGAIEAIQDGLDDPMWLGEIPMQIYDLVKINDRFEIHHSGWIYAVFSENTEDLFLPQSLLIGYRYEYECESEDYELINLSEDIGFNKAITTGFSYAEYTDGPAYVRFLRLQGMREILWVQSEDTDVFIPVDTGLLINGPEFMATMNEIYINITE